MECNKFFSVAQFDFDGFAEEKKVSETTSFCTTKRITATDKRCFIVFQIVLMQSSKKQHVS